MKKAFVLLLTVIVLAGCTAQTQASKLGENVNVDRIPNDICIANGIPVVYGINIEQDDEIAIVYLNKDGLVKAQMYGTGVIGLHTEKMGSLSFSGATCPD